MQTLTISSRDVFHALVLWSVLLGRKKKSWKTISNFQSNKNIEKWKQIILQKCDILQWNGSFTTALHCPNSNDPFLKKLPSVTSKFLELHSLTANILTWNNIPHLTTIPLAWACMTAHPVSNRKAGIRKSWIFSSLETQTKIGKYSPNMGQSISELNKGISSRTNAFSDNVSLFCW